MQVREQREIVARLTASYPVFAEATVSRWVSREAERYATARITAFVPILVERTVRDQLTALDAAE